MIALRMITHNGKRLYHTDDQIKNTHVFYHE